MTSQDFEAAFDAFDSFTADDFVVPNGQTWNVTGVDVAGEYTAGGGPADSFNVIFYDNSGSNLPGNVVASRPGEPLHRRSERGHHADLARLARTGDVLGRGPVAAGLHAVRPVVLGQPPRECEPGCCLAEPG